MQKVIIITGGSEGLGYQIAKTLVFDYKVIILAREETKLKQSASELKCDFEVCDVSDGDAIEKSVQSIIKKHSRIDCLINNAGVWVEGELGKNNPKDIKRMLDVNTLGTILFSRAVIPQMEQQKEGTIINIISQAGFYAKAERSVYTASKFAITGFTKSLQLELAKYGIRVTGVYPGKMETKMFEKVGIEKNMSDSLDIQEVAKTIQFILSLDQTTQFTEIGIKNIKN